MTEHDESVALHEVEERLYERFPSLEHQVVESAVSVAHQSLDGPIRDYVPVLVEHMARDRLSGLGDRSR